MDPFLVRSIAYLSLFACMLFFEARHPFARSRQNKAFRVVFHSGLSVLNSLILYFVLFSPLYGAARFAQLHAFGFVSALGLRLLDVGFLDEASVKISARIAQEVRKQTELPVGGAPCNGLYMWEALRNRSEGAFMAALSATLGYVTAYGLDFLFAEPLRNVEFVAPAVGAVDVYNRYELRSIDPDRTFPEEHPMRAMFR